MPDTNLKKSDEGLTEEQLYFKRRRGRNLAILWTLLALCALFFAITIAQFSKAGHL